MTTTVKMMRIKWWLVEVASDSRWVISSRHHTRQAAYDRAAWIGGRVVPLVGH